jgi:hypothetical protein
VLRRPLEPGQYTSGAYATLADDLAVILSSGRTGQCWDNALAESFFASLKGECLDQQPWPSRAAARRATVEYIAWYNGTRLHSALGYQTPNEYESTTHKEPITQAARPTHQPCPSKRGNPTWRLLGLRVRVRCRCPVRSRSARPSVGVARSQSEGSTRHRGH